MCLLAETRNIAVPYNQMTVCGTTHRHTEWAVGSFSLEVRITTHPWFVSRERSGAIHPLSPAQNHLAFVIDIPQKWSMLNKQSPVTQQGDTNCREAWWHTHNILLYAYWHLNCAVYWDSALSTVQQPGCGRSLTVCGCEPMKRPAPQCHIITAVLWHITFSVLWRSVVSV